MGRFPPISLIDGRGMPQGETACADVGVGVRPEDVEMSGEPANGLPGTIIETYKPSPRNTMFLAIRIGEHEVHAQTEGDSAPAEPR